MSENSSDLRQEILTNEMGNIMIDMVAPVYDRSKVALYLFQAFGITLEKEYDLNKYKYLYILYCIRYKKWLVLLYQPLFY